MGGSQLGLPLFDPAQQGGPQPAALPVGVHLPPHLVVATTIVVLLPAALGVGDRAPVNLREEQVGVEVQARRMVEPARDLGQPEPMRDAAGRHAGVDQLSDGGIVAGALDAAEAQARDRGGIRQQDRHRWISIGL